MLLCTFPDAAKSGLPFPHVYFAAYSMLAPVYFFIFFPILLLQSLGPTVASCNSICSDLYLVQHLTPLLTATDTVCEICVKLASYLQITFC